MTFTQFFLKNEGVPVVAQLVKNPTNIHEDVGLIPGLVPWVKDLALLQAAARSQMQLRSRVAMAMMKACSCSSDLKPLAYELPYEAGVD